MRSLYDDIFQALEDNTFTIPNVTIRQPYDESSKSYPMIVLHEIVNLPVNHGTVNGETLTTLSYQMDIHTQSCVDDDGAVLNRWQAGRRLVAEASDLLDETFKITRRTIRHESPNPDVLLHIWRGDSVYDSNGYAYRP
jgi:hypothetical protein